MNVSEWGFSVSTLLQTFSIIRWESLEFLQGFKLSSLFLEYNQIRKVTSDHSLQQELNGKVALNHEGKKSFETDVLIILLRPTELYKD